MNLRRDPLVDFLSNLFASEEHHLGDFQKTPVAKTPAFSPRSAGYIPPPRNERGAPSEERWPKLYDGIIAYIQANREHSSQEQDGEIPTIRAPSEEGGPKVSALTEKQYLSFSSLGNALESITGHYIGQNLKARTLPQAFLSQHQIEKVLTDRAHDQISIEEKIEILGQHIAGILVLGDVHLLKQRASETSHGPHVGSLHQQPVIGARDYAHSIFRTRPHKHTLLTASQKQVNARRVFSEGKFWPGATDNNGTKVEWPNRLQIMPLLKKGTTAQSPWDKHVYWVSNQDDAEGTMYVSLEMSINDMQLFAIIDQNISESYEKAAQNLRRSLGYCYEALSCEEETLASTPASYQDPSPDSRLNLLLNDAKITLETSAYKANLSRDVRHRGQIQAPISNERQEHAIKSWLEICDRDRELRFVFLKYFKEPTSLDRTMLSLEAFKKTLQHHIILRTILLSMIAPGGVHQPGIPPRLPSAHLADMRALSTVLTFGMRLSDGLNISAPKQHTIYPRELRRFINATSRDLRKPTSNIIPPHSSYSLRSRSSPQGDLRKQHAQTHNSHSIGTPVNLSHSALSAKNNVKNATARNTTRQVKVHALAPTAQSEYVKQKDRGIVATRPLIDFHQSSIRLAGALTPKDAPSRAVHASTRTIRSAPKETINTKPVDPLKRIINLSRAKERCPSAGPQKLTDSSHCMEFRKYGETASSRSNLATLRKRPLHALQSIPSMGQEYSLSSFCDKGICVTPIRHPRTNGTTNPPSEKDYGSDKFALIGMEVLQQDGFINSLPSKAKKAIQPKMERNMGTADPVLRYGFFSYVSPQTCFKSVETTAIRSVSPSQRTITAINSADFHWDLPRGHVNAVGKYGTSMPLAIKPPLSRPPLSERSRNETAMFHHISTHNGLQL